MPLCGSQVGGCGCALTSIPVEDGPGEIDGQYPSIIVDGGGTPDNPWYASLNPQWAGAVVNELFDLDGRVGVNEGDITALDGRVTVSEADIVELQRLGIVGHALKSGAQSSISSVVDVSGTSVTFNASPTRTYKVTAVARIQQATSTATSTLTIADGADTVLASVTQTADATYSFTTTWFYVTSGFSGSTTVKMRASVSSATITAQNGCLILVEDIGPA